ncbi:MAG: hypothetical protein WCG48_02725 [Candidatus Berkelbacteria bacterium]
MAEQEVEKSEKVEEKPLIEIEESDFVAYERSTGWYVVIIVVAVALSAFFYWQQNISGAIFTIATLILFLMMSKTKPKTIKSQVYASGIVVDGIVHKYEELKSFHIAVGDIVKIVFERPGFLSRLIVMPVADDQVEATVAELKKHLTQGDDRGEDIVDRVNRWMRF